MCNSSEPGNETRSYATPQSLGMRLRLGIMCLSENYLHNIRECWIEFTVVMELPFEKLPDALHITLKVPVEGPTTIPHGKQQNHIPLI